jgi:hypothetical protein
MSRCQWNSSKSVYLDRLTLYIHTVQTLKTSISAQPIANSNFRCKRIDSSILLYYTDKHILTRLSQRRRMRAQVQHYYTLLVSLIF